MLHFITSTTISHLDGSTIEYTVFDAGTLTSGRATSRCSSSCLPPSLILSRYMPQCYMPTLIYSSSRLGCMRVCRVLTAWPACWQSHLQLVLPAILDGLADEAEGVRDAALAAGRTFVDLYAQTALPLLLPAVEAGIVNDNWRIRQSSVELLGDLLFKVRQARSLLCG